MTPRVKAQQRVKAARMKMSALLRELVPADHPKRDEVMHAFWELEGAAIALGRISEAWAAERRGKR